MLTLQVSSLNTEAVKEAVADSDVETTRKGGGVDTRCDRWWCGSLSASRKIWGADEIERWDYILHLLKNMALEHLNDPTFDTCLSCFDIHHNSRLRP